MCGIAGVVYADPDYTVDAALLDRMGSSIAHRGPDGAGTWRGRGVGLVHRRLAIIDLEGGKQPLANEDGTVQVVFNGEIYNFVDLRRDLLARGHRFRTNSDTEVLVHLYEEAGPMLVHRLRGMFAFAIWDQRQRLLLLARDRVGIKPLYWRLDQERLLFGSELKVLLADPTVERKLDLAALEAYLAYGVTPGAASIFHGIRKLPPGHTLVLDQTTWRHCEQRYWRLVFEPEHGPTPEEWQEAVRAKVDETVRLHLAADVPVGAFLSGGIDSSIVVTTAARHATPPLWTFSMGFQEEGFDELPAARLIARRLGTRHVEETVVPQAADLIDEVNGFWDEPFGDASAIPTYLVSRLANRSVKVVLSGDGGDEAFGGYARYAHDLREARVRGLLPRWLRRCVVAPLGRCWPQTDWLPKPLRAGSALTNLALEPAAAYANTLAICRSPWRRRLLHPDLRSGLAGCSPEAAVMEVYRHANTADPLAAMLSADTEVLLPDDFLVKVDRASMAHGLEVRPPFLDHELLELAARIPSSLKVRGSQTKWILKQAFASVLPAGILSRPKQGFDVPLDSWLAGPLRGRFYETVLASGSPVSELLDQAAVRVLFEAHIAGRARRGRPLWCVLMLAAWAERYLRPSAESSSAPASRQVPAIVEA